MGKYVTKIVEVDAVRFQIPVGTEIADGTKFMAWPVEIDEDGYFLTLTPLKGDPVIEGAPELESDDYRVDDGDWIVTDEFGERFPVTHEVFIHTYIPHGDDIPSEKFTYPLGSTPLLPKVKEEE